MSEAVRLTVVPDTAEVVTGGRLSLALTIQNTGHSGAHYRLDVSGIPAHWYTLDRPCVALLPAASAQTLLTVHPPVSHDTMAGRYTLTVQVRASEDEAIQASTVVALTVSTGGLAMHVQPAEVVGRKGVFRITLLNQMTWPIPVALTAYDTENGLRFRIEPEHPVVVPGNGVARLVTMHVVPKVQTLLGKPHPYEIHVRSLELGGWRRANQRAHFVYVPRYTAQRLPVWLRRAPRWAVLPSVVLLVLLLVFAGGRILADPATRPGTTPRPAPTRAISSMQPTPPRATVQGITPSTPSIHRFTLAHDRQDRLYELVWQTSDTQYVTLDGQPVSARGKMVLHAPLHNAAYWLVATNGARRATASIHIVVDASTTDRHAFVLRTPDIATFALRRSKGHLYAIWLVYNAMHVRLQGHEVARAGIRLVPSGASRLRLVASNDVGSRQRLLHLARLVPPTTLRPRRTAPTVRPTATPTRRPTMTARPSRLLPTRPTAPPRPTVTLAPPPTKTRAVRPATRSTLRPTETPMPRPTATPTARPTQTPTAHPAVTSTPHPTATPTIRPTRTSTSVSVMVGTTLVPVLLTPPAVPTPRPTATPTPVPTATPTATVTLTPVPTNTPVPTATVSITPTNTPLPFAVTAWVSPGSMPYNSPATLYGQTRPGAICWASLVYNDGSAPTSFSSITQTIPLSGTVAWSWQEETTSTGGAGTVTCWYGGQTMGAMAMFTVY